MTDNEQKEIFESWLGQHRGLLFKIVRAYARTTMDVDDLFQDIVLQVWRSIPSFRHASAVSTWMYRIAINVALSWNRKERRMVPTEAIEGLVLQTDKAPPDERLAWLYAAIHALDEIDRSIALLLLDGFSYKEMAAIMGITESNIGVKINRIKKVLIAKSKKFNCHGI